MHTIDDPRAADAVAVRAGAAVVAHVTAADLGRPTPCAGWNLGDLLAHMTAQHIGFAAAAAGRGADPAVWEPVPFAGPAAYAAAVEHVIAAFAADGALDRGFVLPELSATHAFPGARAIGFHLVDYVAHGWDVARALGLPFTLPEDVLAAALPVAEAVPDGPGRLADGAAFAPRLSMPKGADTLTRILRLLGRDA